jgi:hypothetical protein
MVVGVVWMWWSGGERKEREEDDAVVWRRAEERDGAISDMLTNIKINKKKNLRSQCPSTFTM